MVEPELVVGALEEGAAEGAVCLVGFTGSALVGLVSVFGLADVVVEDEALAVAPMTNSVSANCKLNRKLKIKAKKYFN